MKSYMELVRSKNAHLDLGEAISRKLDDRHDHSFAAVFDRALPFVDAPLEPYLHTDDILIDRINNNGLSQKSLENLFEIPSWTLLEDCQVQNTRPSYNRLKTWVRNVFGQV